MNAAYVMGTKMTDAFASYRFCTAIRGAEGGGKVEGLPAFIFTSRRRRQGPRSTSPKSSRPVTAARRNSARWDSFRCAITRTLTTPCS